MCLAKILFNILKLKNKTADLYPAFHDALKWYHTGRSQKTKDLSANLYVKLAIMGVQTGVNVPHEGKANAAGLLIIWEVFCILRPNPSCSSVYCLSSSSLQNIRISSVRIRGFLKHKCRVARGRVESVSIVGDAQNQIKGTFC